MEQVSERGSEKVCSASGGGKLKYRPKKSIPKSFLPTASQGAKILEKVDAGQENRTYKHSPDASPCDEHDHAGWQSWVGKWVGIGGVKKGILRYFGPTQFADGYWCGVELSEAVGKNNGTVGGVQYFSCHDNFGIFAPVSKVQKIFATPETVMDFAIEQTLPDSCSQSRGRLGSLKDPPKLSQPGIPVSSKMCQSLSETKIAESKIPAPKFTLKSSRSMTIASEIPSMPSSNSHVSSACKNERSSTISEGCALSKGRLKQISEIHPENNSSSLDTSRTFRFGVANINTPEKEASLDVLNRTFNMQSPSSAYDTKFTLGSPSKCSDSASDCEALEKELPHISHQQQHQSPQVLSPDEGSLPECGDPNRTFTCDMQPKRDSLTLLEQILHSTAGKQEDYDDDQQSLELDDSLGILTPSQMKDFTGCFDHPIATMEFEVASIPKTMSCDDVNEIPEFEEVQDITVEYLSENSKQCYCFKGDKNLHTYLESFSPEVSKVLAHQHSCDTNSPLLEQHELGNKQPNSDATKISSPSDPEKIFYRKPFSGQDLRDKVSLASDRDGGNPDQRIDTVDVSNLKVDLDLNQTYKSSSGNDMAAVDKQVVEKKYKDSRILAEQAELVFSNKSEMIQKNITEELMPLKQKSVEIFQNSTVLNVGNAFISSSDTNFPLPETLPEDVKLELFSKPVADSSMEIQETSMNQLSDSLVQSIGVDSQGDESELQRLVGSEDCRMTDVVLPEKERPVSVYTVGSTDTGFQGDEEMDIQSEVESVAVGSADVDPNRISTYSADSCIVSEGTGAYPKSDVASDWELDVEVCDGFAELESSTGFSAIKHSRHVHRSTESVCSSARPGDITPLSESCKPLEVTHEDIRRMERDKGISDGTILEEYPVCDEREKNIDIEAVEFPRSFESDCSELKFVEKSIQVCDLDVKLPGIDKSAQTQDVCLSPETKSPEKLHQLASKKLEPKAAPAKSPRKVETEVALKNNKFKRTDGETVVKKAPLPPPPKPPKKNVMSKIKAMIEATSCRSVGKVEEIKPKVTRPPKKSKWEAVTSKIAQSLAEEKVKPKTIREIRSRVDTNLTGARQVGTGIRSGSSRNNSVIDNEGSIVSGPITPTSKNMKNILHSQREFDSVSGQVITNDFDPEQLPWESSSKQESNSLQNESVITQEPKPRERQHSRSPRPGVTPRSGSPLAPTDVSNISFASLTSHASKSSKLPSNQQSGPASQVETMKKDMPAAPTRKPLSTRPSTITSATRRTTPKSDSKPRSLALGKLHLDSDGKKPSLTSPSKAELNRLNQEIQHLGALCENRTKELNLLKMQLKHTTLGFDAFASLIRYLTEELDSFSHPHMVEELQKTREELKETEHKLKFCEEELEKIKEYHATEISELNEKLTLVKEEEITQLQAKHVSDLEELKTLHEQELAQAADSHETSLKKTQEKHTLEIEELNKEFKRMQEEIVDTHNKQLEAANLYHEETKTTLTSQISNLRKQYEELQKQTKQFEEALQKDTNEKIQWISAKKADLEKEVDSLKAVLEMKRNEIHSLRAENAELKKELEELPLAREKIKMLKARAEDLQALVNQKVRVQRQLSSEHQHLKESFEKESRTNMRLSMEKEELEWKLKQNMEASLLLTSIAGPEILQKFAKEHPTSAPSSLMLSSADLSSLVADTSLNFGDSFEKTSPTVGQQLPKKSPLRSPVSISASTPCSPQLKNTRRKRTTSKSEMNTPAVEPSFNKSEPYSISQDILQSIIANAVEMATNHKQSHKSTKKSPKESTPCSTKEKPELNKKCDKRLEKLDLFLNLEEDTGACHVDDIDIIDDIDLQVENECYDADIAVLEDSLVSDRISSGSRKSHSPLSEGGSCPLEVGGKVKTPLSDNISMNVSRGNASVCESLLDRCLEGVEGGSEEKGLVMEPVFIDVRSGETPKKSERCEFVEPPKVYQVTTPESVKELVVSSKSPVSDGGQTKVILSATQPSCTATHLPTTEDSSSSMQSSMTSSSDSSSWSAALPTSPHHISCEASNASLSSEDPSICSSNGSSRNAVARRDDDQFFATFEECATGGSTPDDGSQHRLHFENITVCHYRVASPRSLAGEAMVQDSTSPSFSQFTSEESSGYRCGGSDHVRPEVDDEFCEQQGSQQLGIPEAPSTLPTFDPPSLEASSQGIILTDSTNIDGSWCEEELPSESEA